jgi:hypothetical protein
MQSRVVFDVFNMQNFHHDVNKFVELFHTHQVKVLVNKEKLGFMVLLVPQGVHKHVHVIYGDVMLVQIPQVDVEC